MPLVHPPEYHLRPVAKHMYKTAQKYPDHVVLTQIGGFYELAFDQADTYGPMIGLRVVQRKQMGLNGAPTFSMAGFPLRSLSKHVTNLVHVQRQKAIILKQAKMDNLLEEAERRPIWRIATPGTMTAELLYNDTSTSNPPRGLPLMALHPGPLCPGDEQEVGVAWTDLIRRKVFFGKMRASEIPAEVARVAPTEILLDQEQGLTDLLKDFTQTHHDFGAENTSLHVYKHLFGDISDHELDFSVSSASALEKKALLGLLDYINHCIRDSISLDLHCPENESSTRMRMDRQTKNGLELFSSTTPCLFNVINETVTPSGHSLLQDWLEAPLRTMSDIEDRLDVVQMFLQNKSLMHDIQSILEKGPDCHRTLQRLHTGKPDISRLMSYARSVFVLENLSDRIRQHVDEHGAPILIQRCLSALTDDLAPCLEIARQIMRVLQLTAYDEPLENKIKRTKIELPNEIPRRFNLDAVPELALQTSNLQTAIDRYMQHFQRVSAKLQSRYSAMFPNARQISYVWHPRFQYTIRVLGKSTEGAELSPLKGDPSFLWQSSASAYVQDPQATKLGSIREGILSWEQSLEQETLRILTCSVRKHSNALHRVLDAMAQIDVLLGFARISLQSNLVRPVLSGGRDLELSSVRHLVAELGNRHRGKDFVTNDCSLTAQKPLWIVSGPNMGGKSTFLRQVAHAVILAQIGCYVPASRAHIGLVDRIFCRIGSSDNVFRGQSTFMVEMLETAMILKNATSRSLTIIDEVGRGSTVKDCMHVAYATVRCLLEKNQCRTLFATHYAREIKSRFTDDQPGIQYCHSRLKLDKKRKKLVFDYKLQQGVSPSSCGFEIAKMAGFPAKGLRIAKLYYTRKYKD